jgi:hypothetical protein
MYGPVLFIWLIQAIRARAPFFFSAVNPAIPTGGWLGESKWDILNRIPDPYLPKTLFIAGGTPEKVILKRFSDAEMGFPCIVKPDVGERGFLVKLIQTEEELMAYFRERKVDMMIQEYISYPVEVSGLVYRIPDSAEVRLTSLCVKGFLEVEGDGKSTLEQLVRKQSRAFLQYEKLSDRFARKWQQIIPKGESILLEPIGNHCLGTRFIDAQGEIDERMTAVFASMLDQMDGIQYGRFDLRTTSLEDLRKGRNFLIFEFNGVGSDPAHIYDARHSIGEVYRVIWKHFSIMRRIWEAQRERGIEAMGWQEAWQAVVDYKRYKKAARKTHD